MAFSREISFDDGFPRNREQTSGSFWRKVGPSKGRGVSEDRVAVARQVGRRWNDDFIWRYTHTL